MLSFQIVDVKAFMASFLKEETFDSFSLVEIEVKTFFTMRLDGKRAKEWYRDEGERTPLPSEYLEWKEVRPIVFEHIRGKKAPLSLKATLRLNEGQKTKFVKNVESPFTPEEVAGLVLNVLYEKESLHLITGVSLLGFHPDKRLDQAWDESMGRFLRKHGLEFEN